jgi:hypothetical protein
MWMSYARERSINREQQQQQQQQLQHPQRQQRREHSSAINNSIPMWLMSADSATPAE